MKVTVVTVAYNAEKTIADTIQSVQAQQGVDYEHLIVDGASSDGTVGIARGLANGRTRITSEPDRGLYDAMNKGIAAATGDLIGFLNADDFFCRSDALAQVVRSAEQSGAAAIAGAVAIVRADAPARVVRSYGTAGYQPWMMRFGHALPHPGFYARREAVQATGPFDASLGISGDFEWMARFFYRERLGFAPLRSTVVVMREGGISTRGFRSLRHGNSEKERALRGVSVRTHSSLLWAKYGLKALQLVLPPSDYPPPPEVHWRPSSAGD